MLDKVLVVPNIKRFALRFVSLLILCSLLVSIPEIRIAKAESTIYIRADGSVDPPTADITSLDNVTYTFTGNINGSIVVERDNIVVDGAGYTLRGTGSGWGIALFPTTKVTIRNMEIRDFGVGICIAGGAGNNNVTGNIITNNRYRGITLSATADDIITGNNITNNEKYGIYFVYSSDNSIVGNNIENNTCGMYFLESSNNIVYHNNFINNTKHVRDAYLDAPWLLEPTVNIWDDGVEGNYWDDYVGVDSDGDGIGDTPHGEDKYPLVLYWVPPTISIFSPENRTYNVNNVFLTFRVSKKPPSWISYSLDGQANVTITGNTTLPGLSYGSHNLIVYANDTSGNIGASETIHFTIAQQTEPFPTWIVAVIVITVVIGAALLVYFGGVKKKIES